MPMYRVRVGNHTQWEEDGKGGRIKVTYSARGKKSVFQSDSKICRDDPGKYERLHEDGRPLNSVPVNPFDRLPHETSEAFVARLTKLAADAQAAAAKVSGTAPASPITPATIDPPIGEDEAAKKIAAANAEAAKLASKINGGKKS